MRILAIETSCDETAIAIVEASGDEKRAEFTILGNALLSQTVHAQYGGVFPALAKREHAKNLVPILEAALEEAELLREDTQVIAEDVRDHVSKILEREPGLAEAFFAFITECEPAAIDAIAVTAGPGLEPALWVGINFARALALAWDKPLVAVNHMEGHIFAALASCEIGNRDQGIGNSTITYNLSSITFPLLALLISGGHTELVLMREWPCLPAGRSQYELVGQTRDDAVGEAFDKVARMLALPYPGGPEISRLAESVRQEFLDVRRPTSDVGRRTSHTWAKLPRPMLHENSCDFSFAGLKTAVLYLLKKHVEVSEEEKAQIALEFENAVTDVLWHKTARALRETDAQTLVIGGGVSANEHIRRVFSEKISTEFPTTTFQLPTKNLSTDNAIMIALAGYYRALRKEFVPPPFDTLRANGNLSLANKA